MGCAVLQSKVCDPVTPLYPAIMVPAKDGRVVGVLETLFRGLARVFLAVGGVSPILDVGEAVISTACHQVVETEGRDNLDVSHATVTERFTVKLEALVVFSAEAQVPFLLLRAREMAASMPVTV